MAGHTARPHSTARSHTAGSDLAGRHGRLAGPGRPVRVAHYAAAYAARESSRPACRGKATTRNTIGPYGNTRSGRALQCHARHLGRVKRRSAHLVGRIAARSERPTVAYVATHRNDGRPG